MITCSCGHKVENMEDCFTIPIKDMDKSGSKCIGYPTVCEECKNMYIEHNQVLATKKERNRYLNEF